MAASLGFDRPADRLCAPCEALIIACLAHRRENACSTSGQRSQELTDGELDALSRGRLTVND
jgi:hypothetical protein